MNKKINSMILAIAFCASPALAQNSGAMIEEAKYKAAAEVEQTKSKQTNMTAPAYQNVKIHKTVEQKQARSQRKVRELQRRGSSSMNV